MHSSDAILNHLTSQIVDNWTDRAVKIPQPKDAAIFLSTEVAEVLDALMRIEPGWVRTNDKEVDPGDELADVLMLTLTTARALGVDDLVDRMITKMSQPRQGE